jgi:hypothetical protein
LLADLAYDACAIDLPAAFEPKKATDFLMADGKSAARNGLREMVLLRRNGEALKGTRPDQSRVALMPVRTRRHGSTPSRKEVATAPPVVTSSDQSYDLAIQQRLRTMSEDLTGVKFHL